MNRTVYLRDGCSADVLSDEVICQGTARFVDVSQVPAESYIELVVFAAGTWQRVEAAAGLMWHDPPLPPPLGIPFA